MSAHVALRNRLSHNSSALRAVFTIFTQMLSKLHARGINECAFTNVCMFGGVTRKNIPGISSRVVIYMFIEQNAQQSGAHKHIVKRLHGVRDTI